MNLVKGRSSCLQVLFGEAVLKNLVISPENIYGGLQYVRNFK